MAIAIAQHEFLTMDLARDALNDTFRSSFTVLLPLYGTFGVLALLIQSVQSTITTGAILTEAVLRLVVFLLALTAQYWGVFVTIHPNDSPQRILWRSVKYIWAYPLPTMLLTGAVLLVTLLCIISVGGLFLAAPVLNALLQVSMVRHLTR
jgi:hypothetical protein